MQPRQRALAVLGQVRDLLADRLAERILESSHDLLDDAAGESFRGEIEILHEQFGTKLALINQLISNFPSEVSDGELPDLDPADEAAAAQGSTSSLVSLRDSTADMLEAGVHGEPIPQDSRALPGPIDWIDAGEVPVTEIARAELTPSELSHAESLIAGDYADFVPVATQSLVGQGAPTAFTMPTLNGPTVSDSAISGSALTGSTMSGSAVSGPMYSGPAISGPMATGSTMGFAGSSFADSPAAGLMSPAGESSVMSSPMITDDPPSFVRFLREIRQHDLSAAGATLGVLLDLPSVRGVECAAHFAKRLDADKEFLSRALQLRQELASDSANGALVLLWECFGLQGVDSLLAWQTLRNRNLYGQ